MKGLDIYIIGEMGGGKTTLARYIAWALAQRSETLNVRLLDGDQFTALSECTPPPPGTLDDRPISIITCEGQPTVSDDTTPEPETDAPQPKAKQYLTVESFNEHVRPGSYVWVGHPDDSGSWRGHTHGTAYRDDVGNEQVLVQPVRRDQVDALVPVPRIWVPESVESELSTDEWFLRMPGGTEVSVWDRDRRGYLEGYTTDQPYLRGDRNIAVQTTRGTFLIEQVRPLRSYDGIESPQVKVSSGIRRPAPDANVARDEPTVTLHEEKGKPVPLGEPAYALTILRDALDAIDNRAAERDRPEGERSMAATVGAFNALTGHTLTEREGWVLMALLKLSRAQGGALREDDYIDGAAYMALAGEAALRANKPDPDGEGDASDQ